MAGHPSAPTGIGFYVMAQRSRSPRTQGLFDPGRSHLCPGSESRVTAIHMKESFSQEIHISTASSLAGLVSEISQGQQGFGVGIKPRQPDVG